YVPNTPLGGNCPANRREFGGQRSINISAPRASPLVSAFSAHSAVDRQFGALTWDEGGGYTGATMLLGLDTASYRLAAGLAEWKPSQSPPMRLEHFLRKAAELSLAQVAISDLRL